MIIFYSAGELTRQWLHESGRQARYEPYADRLGLYARSLSWYRYRQALAKHWQPYLDGTSDRTESIGKSNGLFHRPRPPTPCHSAPAGARA